MSPIDSSIWQALGWTMLHFLWVGAGLWFLAGVTRRLTRNARPSIRYVMALGFLAALILLPVILLSFLPVGASAPPLAADAGSLPAIGPGGVVSPLESSNCSAGAHTTILTEQSIFRDAHEDTWLESLASQLPWIWILGAPAMLVHLCLGLLGLRGLRRDSEPLQDRRMDGIARRLTRSLGFTWRVTIRVSSRVATPVLLGIVRPLILVPPAMLTGCTPEQIEMVLMHELAHLRRWDNLIILLQRVVEALLFFHPAVWYLSRWIHTEREFCCDAFVVARTGSPRVYADTLYAFADRRLSTLAPAAAMSRHDLENRIRRLVTPERIVMSASERALVVLSTLIVALVFAMVLQGGSAAGQSTRPPSAHPGLPDAEWGHPGGLCSPCHDTSRAFEGQQLLKMMSKPRCLDCHGQSVRTWQVDVLHRHPQDLCLTCHQAPKAAASAQSDSSCTDCHQFEHRFPGPVGQTDCTNCHTAVHEFPDHPAAETCTKCHVGDHIAPNLQDPRSVFPQKTVPRKDSIEDLLRQADELRRQIEELQKYAEELFGSRKERMATKSANKSAPRILKL